MRNIDIWAGYEMTRTAKAPRALFSHLHQTLFRVAGSQTAKFHSSRTCPHVKGRNARLSSVRIDGVSLTESKCCVCMPTTAPDEWHPVLEPAQRLSDLVVAATTLRAQLAAGDPIDLNAAATLRTSHRALPTLRADLLTALSETGAPAESIDVAHDWLCTVEATSGAVVAQVDTFLDADPDLELRAAAAMLVGDIDSDFKDTLYPALTGDRWRMSRSLRNAADLALRDALSTTERDVDIAAVRAAVVAVVDDAHPESLAQLPKVPVKAGRNLRKVVTKAWRKAARAELGHLVERRLGEYTEALAQDDLVVLIASPHLDGVAAGLLVRCHGLAVQPYCSAYLVPRAIGRAVAATNTHVIVADAPLPGPHPTYLKPGFTETDARRFLGGTYVTTLVTLLDELCVEDAVVAALGVAHAA